jgi:hypothetical protein
MYLEVMHQLHPECSLRELLLVFEYGLSPWGELEFIHLECACSGIVRSAHFDRELHHVIELLTEVTSG